MISVVGDVVFCLFVTAGTGIQMVLALPEIAASKRGPLQELNAEDELVRELPRRERRRTKRQLVRERSPEVRRGIQTAFLHVVAWALLFAAAVMALLNAFATGR